MSKCAIKKIKNVVFAHYGNVPTIENFERLMLHLITHSNILDNRVNKEIEEEINLYESI